MNILIVNQSVIDMCASFFTLLTAAVEVDATGMSRDSVYDQFVCRIWLTRTPLWVFLVTSTYGILLTAVDRYVAVIHPIWYKVTAVALVCLFGTLPCLHAAPRVQLSFRQVSQLPTDDVIASELARPAAADQYMPPTMQSFIYRARQKSNP